MDYMDFVSTLLLHTGVVVAIGSAFWGFYFSYQSHHEPEASQAWGGLARSVVPIFVAAVLLYGIGWFVSYDQSDIQLIFGILLLILAVFFALIQFDNRRLHSRLEISFFAALAVSLALVLFAQWSIFLFAEAAAFGTVIVVAWLSLLSSSEEIQEKLHDTGKFFLTVTWIGVAVDGIMAFATLNPSILFGELPVVIEVLFGASVALLAVLGSVVFHWQQRALRFIAVVSGSALFVTLAALRTARSFSTTIVDVQQFIGVYLLVVLVAVVMTVGVRKLLFS